MNAADTACRLIIDEPAEGAWNMAVDEMLLTQQRDGPQAVLRFYRWSVPTLSLGYFQRYENRLGHQASASCSVVRRASGGGAILHDRELTYSLVWPERNRFSSHGQALYDVVHEGLVACLRETGISAGLRPSVTKTEDQPFLCFQRKASGDVLLDGHKVAGSAQRRLHGALLQHGSLLLGRSPFAPELPGILELTGQTLDESYVVECWSARIADRLSQRLERWSPSAKELETAARIAEERFLANAWTRKR